MVRTVEADAALPCYQSRSGLPVGQNGLAVQSPHRGFTGLHT